MDTLLAGTLFLPFGGFIVPVLMSSALLLVEIIPGSS